MWFNEICNLFSVTPYLKRTSNILRLILGFCEVFLENVQAGSDVQFYLNVLKLSDINPQNVTKLKVG